MNVRTHNELSQEKTQFQHGYCHAHVMPKDAIAMPG